GDRITILEGRLELDLTGVSVLAYDWDGTLFNSLEQVFKALIFCYKKYGNEDKYRDVERKFKAVGPFSWTKSLIKNSPIKPYLISNKTQSVLLREVKQAGLKESDFLDVIGDADKPNKIEIFTNISDKGLYIGDSFSNDLPVALMAGWEYQYLSGH